MRKYPYKSCCKMPGTRQLNDDACRSVGWYWPLRQAIASLFPFSACLRALTTYARLAGSCGHTGSAEHLGHALQIGRLARYTTKPEVVSTDDASLLSSQSAAETVNGKATCIGSPLAKSRDLQSHFSTIIPGYDTYTPPQMHVLVPSKFYPSSCNRSWLTAVSTLLSPSAPMPM